VDISVIRSDGSDGTIFCMLKTEQLTEFKTTSAAVEFEDYVPKIEKLTFAHQMN
jgi:hypothetical protein